MKKKKSRFPIIVVLLYSAFLVLILIESLWITFHRDSKPYLSAHVPNSIVSIEVLHNKHPDAYNLDSCHKIGELTRDEIPEFMHQLYGLELRHAHPGYASPGYGNYIAKVTYENGDLELLGSEKVKYVPNGEALSVSSRDYFEEEAFTAILDQYVDISPYVTAMQQLPEDVDRIEILHARFGQYKVIGTVEGDEILPFLSALNELKFVRAAPEREESLLDSLLPLDVGPQEHMESMVRLLFPGIWLAPNGYAPEVADSYAVPDSQTTAPLTLRICYKDGYYDLLSTVPSSYHKPDGSNVKTVHRYYVWVGDDLLTLLEDFLGEENVPDVQYES